MCAITQPHKRLNLVHHPALVGLTLQFLTEVSFIPLFYLFTSNVQHVQWNSLTQTPMGQKKVSIVVKFPFLRG